MQVQSIRNNQPFTGRYPSLEKLDKLLNSPGGASGSGKVHLQKCIDLAEDLTELAKPSKAQKNWLNAFNLKAQGPDGGGFLSVNFVKQKCFQFGRVQEVREGAGKRLLVATGAPVSTKLAGNISTDVKLGPEGIPLGEINSLKRGFIS